MPVAQAAYTLGRMSQSEYLRRKMEAAPKRVAPRPIGDSSTLTAARRMTAVANGPANYNDGQNQVRSSEWVAAKKAGCAICADPPQVVHEVPCCPDAIPALPDPVPAALQGSERVSCCPPVASRVPEPDACCRTGTTNTWWANQIGPNARPALPACTTCPPPPVQCCDETGAGTTVCVVL